MSCKIPIILMCLLSCYLHNVLILGEVTIDRCEFILNETLISDESVLLPSCLGLSKEERKAWDKENYKLDQFYSYLDKAEVKLSKASPDDFAEPSSSNLCPDLNDYLLNRNESETESNINFYLRGELYRSLNVYDNITSCNNISDVIDHCDCMNNVRNEMIEWLIECVKL